MIEAVTDDAILEAYRFLAKEESVFCEPASAASVAGLVKVGAPPGARVVLCAYRSRAERIPTWPLARSPYPGRSMPTWQRVMEELAL